MLNSTHPRIVPIECGMTESQNGCRMERQRPLCWPPCVWANQISSGTTQLRRSASCETGQRGQKPTRKDEQLRKDRPSSLSANAEQVAAAAAATPSNNNSSSCSAPASKWKPLIPAKEITTTLLSESEPTTNSFREYSAGTPSSFTSSKFSTKVTTLESRIG